MDTKYLYIGWARKPRPDGRNRRFCHNKQAGTLYIQLFRLEVVLWYWDKSNHADSTNSPRCQ